MGMFPKPRGIEKETRQVIDEFERNDAAIAAQIHGEAIPGQDDPLEFVAKDGTAFETALAGLVNYHSMEGAAGNTPDFIVAQFLTGAMKLFGAAVQERERMASEAETTFGFYVDGYSVHSTPKIGEVRVVRYDGKEATIKSGSLTAFFDRRIDPPNVPKEGS